ncbi:MAG: hypothetical protein EXR86_16480 [Gammaproteobacteria bacterium]|nr:hypothetical protein [Gammaproteobacteria bacterium]
MTTMLQLVQQVTAELGVSTPSSVAGNASQDVIQILALMNATGYELMTVHKWRALTKPYRFTTSFTTTTGTWTTAASTITAIPSTTGLDTTYMAVGTGINQDTFISSVDSSTQVTLTQAPSAAGTAAAVTFSKTQYSLPSDYESLVPRTMWSKTDHWELMGPEDAQQWEWLLSGYISTGPRIRWRLYGSYFQIWPPSSTAKYLGFEYRSTGWALSAASAVKTSFTVDTDTCIYPDRLMVLSTKLKYFEAKGFDTTAMYRNYIIELEASEAQDMSAANLSFAPKPGQILVGYDNIPDSGYGS